MDGPILREPSDEADDHQEILCRAENEEYLDWPNEAGFENLEEHRGPIELHIHGSFPPWTAGSLFRTGPGINKIKGTPCGPDGVFRISHWFDGLAHTHRFDIIHDNTAKVKVMYSSRRQSDKWVDFVQKKGPCNIITFAQKADPCVGLFSKVMSTWKSATFGIHTETADFENAGVTVQLGIPGLPSKAGNSAHNASSSSSSSSGGGHRSPSSNVWLGTDGHMLCEVDRDTLEPLGLARQNVLHPSLDGPCSCAHAQRCPRTGDYFNVNLKPGAAATYRIFRVSAATGKTDILATIRRLDLPPIYFHSFFLSEHFVVLCLPSSHLKAYGLGVLWEKNMLDAIVPFDQGNKCKWFVIDRVQGRGVVAEFETEAGFFFHTVNCFEEPIVSSDEKTNRNEDEGKVHIFCDMVEYPTMDITHSMYYDVLMNRQGHARSFWADPKRRNNTLPRLARWSCTVALPKGDAQAPETDPSPVAVSSIWSYRPFSWVVPAIASQLPSSWSPANNAAAAANQARVSAEKILTILAPHVGELPTINPAYHTRPYRYIYSLAMSGRSTLTDSIIKTDTVTRQVRRWNNPQGHTPGEAIFVARPGETDEEDDGMLLSVVLDGVSGKSYLLCLNAKTMMEEGRAEMDFAVGLGFHGVHTTDV